MAGFSADKRIGGLLWRISVFLRLRTRHSARAVAICAYAASVACAPARKTPTPGPKKSELPETAANKETAPEATGTEPLQPQMTRTERPSRETPFKTVAPDDLNTTAPALEPAASLMYPPQIPTNTLCPELDENARKGSESLFSTPELKTADLAFLTALSAHAGKKPQTTLATELGALGVHVERWLISERQGVFGYVATLASASAPVLVFFRGTQDLAGTIADGKFFTKRADGRDVTGLLTFPGLRFRGWMHSGFYDAFYAVSDQLERALADFRGRKVMFTGHSLGGALALISAAHAAQQGADVHAVVTKGQPRVGDPDLSAHFSELLGSRHTRIVLDSDVVAHLPPTAEGAPPFSVVSGVLPGVGALSGSVFRTTRYTHGGKRISLSGMGALETTDEADGPSDLAYWSKLEAAGRAQRAEQQPSALPISVSLPSRNAEIGAAVASHDAQRYHCAMLRALSSDAVSP